jgi:hypothetical protein
MHFAPKSTRIEIFIYFFGLFSLFFQRIFFSLAAFARLIMNAISMNLNKSGLSCLGISETYNNHNQQRTPRINISTTINA